jgi:hypothetical protein
MKDESFEEYVDRFLDFNKSIGVGIKEIEHFSPSSIS